MSRSKYDSYGGDSASADSDSGSYENVELRLTTRATIHGVPNRVFGTENQFGQSLGVNMNDVRLDDGLIYYYPDKDRYKLFSWKAVAGLDPWEMLDRGMDMEIMDLIDGNEIYTESYGNDTQTYELIAARLPELDDGDNHVDAQAVSRDVTMDGGTPQFTEWEQLGDERVPFHNTIMWMNGSEEYGPTTVSKTLFEKLTTFGEDAVVDEDDLYNWLPDTSGEDLLRPDLEDRQVELFLVLRQGENNSYQFPVLNDLSTGEEISPYNRGGDSGNSSGGDDSGPSSPNQAESQLRQAEAQDRDSYPEPVADFVTSAGRLSLDEERANQLLDELLASEDNAMTDEMLDECGGRDVVLNEVL